MARSAEPECVKSDLSAGLVRAQLGSYPLLLALKATIQEIKLSGCVQNGQVLVNVLVSPPSEWSPRRLPYSLWLTMPVDGASGAVAAGQELRELPQLVRRVMSRAEAHPDLVAFIERFGVSVATIDRGPEQRLEVRLVGVGKQPGPSITYVDGENGERAGFVRVYRIPRMDGLPARRELLRMLEVVSSELPRCRPLWIEAERRPPTDGAAEEWFFRMDIEGEGCPAAFAARLGPDGRVARLPGAMEAKGGSAP